MQQNETKSVVDHVAIVGNYLPRQCGIATFTTDLAEALSGVTPSIECAVVAMNDPDNHYVYDRRVRFEVSESELASYRRAADFLNVGAYDVLSLQHEYGIFGGKAGSHVLALLRDLRMPIVTTLHTILANPSHDQRRVLDEIVELSSRIVVMSRHGAELMTEVHGVSSTKVDVIPHGIHALPSGETSRERLGLMGKSVILTFGLLSPDKGIEYVIEALPEIVRHHPETTYIVLGVTHPHVRAQHGEGYRNTLELQARRLGVESNIIFHDRFVSLPELSEFLSAADIYITPYLNMEQITSGTLAYAIGAGKAVVSTPYRYAKELLADARGVLVPPKSGAAIAETVCALLGDRGKLHAMGQRAAQFGQNMGWPSVARQYLASMDRAVSDQASQRRSSFEAKTLAKRALDVPELNLEHLIQMTDDTGLIQHASYATPRREDGYCLDDNARALLLMSTMEDVGLQRRAAARALSARYLAFVCHSFNKELGRFRNFMSYSRNFTESEGSEDSHGRALWALGAVVGRAKDPGRQSLGGQLFHEALPASVDFQSPRAWAFVLLGVGEYLQAFGGESVVQKAQHLLAHRLLAAFHQNSSQDWPWCEQGLAYDNARLAQALVVSGDQLGNREMTEAGLCALQWLAEIQRSEQGYFEPIGSNGFYTRGGRRSRFDQQPIEACAMVSACLDAWRSTGDERWAREMRRAFRWFVGENALHMPLYDSRTGGCRDGLHTDRANDNQGAESTLSFLLARTEMVALEGELRLLDRGIVHAPETSTVCATHS